MNISFMPNSEMITFSIKVWPWFIDDLIRNVSILAHIFSRSLGDYIMIQELHERLKCAMAHMCRAHYDDSFIIGYLIF